MRDLFVLGREARGSDLHQWVQIFNDGGLALARLRAEGTGRQAETGKKKGPDRGLEVGRQGYDRVSVEGANIPFCWRWKRERKGRRRRKLDVWIIGGLEFWRVCRSPYGSCVTGPYLPLPR